MIPLYRTYDMEGACNILVQHFRMVYVRSCSLNLAKIRIRPDLITKGRLRFYGSRAQLEHWKKEGGVYIIPGAAELRIPHDAILFTECPRDVDIFDRCCQATRSVAVIYYPPTWRLHDEAMAFRFGHRPPHELRMFEDRLTRMRQLLDAAPEFTASDARRLRHALLVPKSPPLSAPLPDAPAAHAAGTDPRAP